MVLAGGERDLAAEIRGEHLQPKLALVARHGAIDRIDEEEIGLAGLQSRLHDALPELTGVDLAHDRVGLRAAQREARALAHRLHECIGDVDAVMQIEALAVEIAGRLADLQELLDLRMMDVEIDRRRVAPPRTASPIERTRPQ